MKATKYTPMLCLACTCGCLPTCQHIAHSKEHLCDATELWVLDTCPWYKRYVAKTKSEVAIERGDNGK